MKTLNQICGGIVIGSVLAFILGFVAFQSKLFSDGMNELGIGRIGLGYFLGGFLVSVMFALMGGKKLPLAIFGLAVVAVGSLGLNQLMAGGYAQSGGDIHNFSQTLSALTNSIALVLFWGTPGLSCAFYAFTRWEKYSLPNQPDAQ